LDRPPAKPHLSSFVSIRGQIFSCSFAVSFFFAFFALFCGYSLTLHAADQTAAPVSRPLDIRVQANGFGKASSADITAVLQSAAFEILRHCPQTQLDGIDVYHRTDHPQTGSQRTANGRIPVALSAQDTHWAQYAFQFAHELSHVLANYANSHRLVRYPPQVNFWLEESLCETASLFALRAMSRSWRSSPPYPAWGSYAPWFDNYVEQRLAQPQYQLPVGKPFLVWFRENQTVLRQDSTTWDRNTIVATQLLPIFEAEPSGWESLVFLNRGSHQTTESLEQRLAEWRSQCPKPLRPFVSRIATVFAVKL